MSRPTAACGRAPGALPPEVDLRLSPAKIEYLSAKILKLMQDSRRIHLTASPDLVTRTIADIIFANMRLEEDIDTEVDKLLGQHRGEIEALEMDLGLLRAKMKREIAKKRGFTL
jgi:hypothetical protein